MRTFEAADDDESKFDLSLFERAMQGMDDTAPQGEYDIIRKVIKQLAEELGVDLTTHGGRELGSSMSLNHRIHDFTEHVGAITGDIAEAIQSNTFTREMADRLLTDLQDEEGLFIKSSKELEKMQFYTQQLIEALLFLGQTKYEHDQEMVQDLKDAMLGDIHSYDLMISTFSTYYDFLDSYIQNRPIEDREIVDLNEAVTSRIRDRRDIETRFPGSIQIQTVINGYVKAALNEKKGGEISIGELRQIIRAYNDAFIIIENDNDTLIPHLNQESLDKCIEFIRNS
ncbi:MAG: hypothetical protein JNK26_04695 [Candidatus Doudnabacteria bacterium]|nr:hypothetical protein [Candidatus Doudnabacteria bacterium]